MPAFSSTMRLTFMKNPHSRSLFILVFILTLAVFNTGCGKDEPTDANQEEEDFFFDDGGKSDAFGNKRSFEVLLTEPFCDICTTADKNHLATNSVITERVIELINAAEKSVDVAQYTFSVREIEQALVNAAARGVKVRLAIDAGQDKSGTAARRLRDQKIPVSFVKGPQLGNQNRFGLLHSKFMIVDRTILLSGSNNWSSTGVTINEENTIVMKSVEKDPLIDAFACHFDSAWNQKSQDSTNCSTNDARFSPGSAARVMLRDSIRNSKKSVDVLMHHLLFDDLVKDLAQAAERGVKVRIITNLEDRAEHTGKTWDRLQKAGGKLRFKQTNPDTFQLMHHKLAVIDGQTLLHGSGNWSGSGFFNNYEFYVRYRTPDVVEPFNALFSRLWSWSLDAATLDQKGTAATQHFNEHTVYFGNLHAHYEEHDENGKYLDDGEMKRADEIDGTPQSVHHELGDKHVTRYAWEYARDKGRMDFMALSPHTVDTRADDAKTHPSTNEQSFKKLLQTAREINAESANKFVAIPAMEWNTNTAGNHVNIFGTEVLCKVERDRFDILYEEFLPERTLNNERPFLQFNHPRTFTQNDESLAGAWDQIFDVYLTDIPKAGERRQKFNDYGLDDFAPLNTVRDSWISGETMPDRDVVAETLRNIEQITRPYLRMMEVTIGRGTDIAHELGVNPSMVERDGEITRYTRVDPDWHYYLLQGFQLAPTANHDNHYANWGTGHTSRTAVIAKTLSEKSLLDAIDQRMVYASEDENLAVHFYADARFPMGSNMETTAKTIAFSTFLTDPDYNGNFQVRLMHGHINHQHDNTVQEVARLDAATKDTWLNFTARLDKPGKHFFYLEVLETDAQRMAWTAPIWITKH